MSKDNTNPKIPHTGLVTENNPNKTYHISYSLDARGTMLVEAPSAKEAEEKFNAFDLQELVDNAEFNNTGAIDRIEEGN